VTAPTGDVAAVIGGGPAGLMAAEVLAAGGVRVVVYDHMGSVGRKLLLAGRSGLNLTHAEPLDRFLDRYGLARPVLEPTLRAFTPGQLRAWAAGLGEATSVGSSGRVFPASWRAAPLLRAWLGRLESLGVTFAGGHRWIGWAPDGALTFTAPAAAAEVVVHPAATVLALGGASWPRAGSDGTWVPQLRAAGIRVTDLRPANAGFDVAWTAGFVERFAGSPLKNLRLTVGGTSVRGEAVVTAYGVESGVFYALGAALRDEIEARGSAIATTDLHPDRPVADLAARLRNRRPRETSTAWLRRAGGLAPVAVGLLREATGNALPADAGAMAALIKAVPLRLTGIQPLARAISTAGGVALDEVDAGFMLRSRPGTFVAGEMLDWEAPTGGYLLQACFATGRAAGKGALAWISHSSKTAPTEPSYGPGDE
jgi:uncharacterized flavoprotein (TIGR03862 family)